MSIISRGDTVQVVNNLTVAANATVGSLTVGSTATIGTSMLVGTGGITFTNPVSLAPAPLIFNENITAVAATASNTNAAPFNLYFSRVGKSATMMWDNVTWTQNFGPGTITCFGIIPPRFRPTVPTSHPYGMRNFGSDSVSLIFISTGGDISWRINTGFAAAWSTGSSSFAIYQGTASWISLL